MPIESAFLSETFLISCVYNRNATGLSCDRCNGRGFLLRPEPKMLLQFTSVITVGTFDEKG